MKVLAAASANKGIHGPTMDAQVHPVETCIESGLQSTRIQYAARYNGNIRVRDARPQIAYHQRKIGPGKRLTS